MQDIYLENGVRFLIKWSWIWDPTGLEQDTVTLHSTGYKTFSSSAQLSMKFQLHVFINAEIVKISGKFRFKTQNLVIYPAGKC